MKSIKQYLRDRSTMGEIYNLDEPVRMEDVVRLIKGYATEVRDEQIRVSAVASACYTAKTVRGVPGRLDDDYKQHLIVPKVEIVE